MDTLCEDLLFDIFKCTLNNEIVYPFTILYGEKYLQFKRFQVLENINSKLKELFGDKRYDMFTENSVLTGSLLLKLILGENWRCGDIDIIQSEVNINIDLTDYTKFDRDHFYVMGVDFVDENMVGKIQTMLKLVSCDYYTPIVRRTRSREKKKMMININTIDSNLTTIDEHINRFDYSFVKNYAFYKNGKLQVHILHPENVFGRFGDFNTSMAIWMSGNRFGKYKRRGFDIKWSEELLELCVNNFVDTLCRELKDVDIVDLLIKLGFGVTGYGLASNILRMRRPDYDKIYDTGLPGISQLIITYILSYLSESEDNIDD